jgi:tetratricopeptide (TPR) repeat protein
LRRWLAVTVLVGAMVGPSCAPRVAPPIPEGEDYVYPTPVAAQPVSAKLRQDLEKAWKKVLSGDAQGGVRAYRKILSREPDWASAQTGLAYAYLRAGQVQAASAQFALVLDQHPDYLPALMGAASAAVSRDEVEQALGLYRRALAVAPDDHLVRKRTASLKLRVTERHMAAAQAAQGKGDLDTAIGEYRAALGVAPEVAGMRLALADLLVTRGNPAGAVQVLREDPTGDREIDLRLGELLLDQGEYEEARSLYREMLAADPGDADARTGLRTAQENLDLQSQPEEYRRIPSAAQATRADVAALLAVKVTALARLPMSEPRVAVDISGSWAAEEVATIVGLGIMDVYPNHTFQPRATVRRGELARILARVLTRLGWRGPAGPSPSDMQPSHLDYDAVRQVTGAGLMSLGMGGEFQPWRPVTGREAAEAVESLARLVGP